MTRWCFSYPSHSILPKFYVPAIVLPLLSLLLPLTKRALITKEKSTSKLPCPHFFLSFTALSLYHPLPPALMIFYSDELAFCALQARSQYQSDPPLAARCAVTSAPSPLFSSMHAKWYQSLHPPHSTMSPPASSFCCCCCCLRCISIEYAVHLPVFNTICVSGIRGQFNVPGSGWRARRSTKIGGERGVRARFAPRSSRAAPLLRITSTFDPFQGVFLAY